MKRNILFFVVLCIASIPAGNADTISINTDADAAITSASPNANSSGGTLMSVRYAAAVEDRRILVHFNTSSIPAGSAITSAQAYLYFYSAPTSSSVAVHAYNITSAWTENDVTWNTAPTNEATELDQIALTNVYDWYAWDITPAVKGWFNGTLTNNGIIFMTTSEDDYKRFRTLQYGSLIPYLYVTYTPAPSVFIPPAPTLDTVTFGNFWKNITFSAGSGNVTNGFNVSRNGTWYNGTATFINSTASAHGWINDTVYAFNSSGSGTLSLTALTNNTQIPNNPITLSNISDTYYTDIGSELAIYPTYSDADGDTPLFGNSTTKGTFYTNNGTFIWTPQAGDSGTYNWYINVTDNNGSTVTKAFGLSVNSSIPGAPLNISSTFCNFCINTSWSVSVNTDTFNISLNGVWFNGTSITYYNLSNTTPHAWLNVSVQGYNSTSQSLGNVSTLNSQIPNNAPTMGGSSISGDQIYPVSQYLTITLNNVSDLDGDSLSNVLVGISYLGFETNYTMIQTANTSTWTYAFNSGVSGFYTVTAFYATDNNSATTKKTTSHAFSVTSLSTGGTSGGGGAVVQPTPTPTATPRTSSINLLSVGKDTTGRRLLQVTLVIGSAMVLFGLLYKRAKLGTLVSGGVVVIGSVYGLGWF